MTEQDVIKTLRELWRETNDPWYEETYDMAISALEKQIPKKPKMPIDSYWICPICGTKVDHPHPFRHCMGCGQMIDWRTNNDK